MGNNEYLEEKVNEKLGTDIEWSQLPSEDLEEFNNLLSNEQFLKRIAGQYASDVVGSETKNQIENWEIGQLASLVTDDDMDIDETIEMIKMMV